MGTANSLALLPTENAAKKAAFSSIQSGLKPSLALDEGEASEFAAFR
jgi:hypothetical protein